MAMAIETRGDLVSGTWTRAEAAALAEAADVGVRVAERLGTLLRPDTSAHAVSQLKGAIAAAGRGRTAPVSLAWTRAEAAALAARAHEGIEIGEEFGLVDDTPAARRALEALRNFIVDAELVPAPAPQPPRRAKAARTGAGPASRPPQRRSRASAPEGHRRGSLARRPASRQQLASNSRPRRTPPLAILSAVSGRAIGSERGALSA